MTEVVVDFDQTRVDGRTRRRIRVRHPRLDPEFATAGLSYDFLDGRKLPEPLVLDACLFAVLMTAMDLGAPLRINGPVSRTALRNARIYQEAWHCWLPERYHVVDIIAERAVSNREIALRRMIGRSSDAAISAFSGGIDASFLAIRHSPRGALPAGSKHNLGSVVMVHGFDVPLNEDATFAALVARVRPLIDHLGLELHTVKTDIKRLGQWWTHSYAAHTAAVLHQFSHRAETGMIGSSEPYNYMLNAWGSTPSTDYLLSGADMSIVHEGAGYSRTRKTELIAAHPIARRTVKFCWQGSDASRNCGRCEKCVRTRLNFMAVGAVDPPCFDQPLDLDDISKISVNSIVQIPELETIIAYATERQLTGRWLDLLRARVAELKAESARSG